MRTYACALALLFFPVSILADLQYGFNHAPVQKDPDWVDQQFFPVDKAWQLLSPVFTDGPDDPEGWANGTTSPTTDATMTRFLEGFAGRHSAYAQYHELEQRSPEGRVIPYVYLSNGDLSTAKVRVWLQGAHGNESGGEANLLALIGQLDANSTRTALLLEKLDIIVLPRYNPDGAFYYQRFLPDNLDPNRDHITVTHPQTRAIKALLNHFQPHIAVDMHDFSAGRRWLNGRYAHSSDMLLAGAKNLNIDAAIRNLTENLVVTRIRSDLDKAGFRHSDYVTSAKASNPLDIRFNEAGPDAMIGRNSVGLSQTISLLTETRGINLADQHFARRVASCLCTANAILDGAWESSGLILETIDQAVKRVVETDDDIIVTSHSRIGRRPYPFIDLVDQKLVEHDIEFAFTTPVVANLTRPRPHAYLIPAAYSGIADRLRALGLHVETLTEPWTGPVEALRITSASAAPHYFETAFRYTVTTKPYDRVFPAPNGSFVVRTDQKHAALAFVALEPESTDSFVTFNLMPVIKGDEYPIFRVMSDAFGPSTEQARRPDLIVKAPNQKIMDQRSNQLVLFGLFAVAVVCVGLVWRRGCSVRPSPPSPSWLGYRRLK